MASVHRLPTSTPSAMGEEFSACSISAFLLTAPILAKNPWTRHDLRFYDRTYDTIVENKTVPRRTQRHRGLLSVATSVSFSLSVPPCTLSFLC